MNKFSRLKKKKKFKNFKAYFIYLKGILTDKINKKVRNQKVCQLFLHIT